MIDTGFTSHLTLPAEVVENLALERSGFVEVELADGGIADLEVYDAWVLWHGKRHPIPVYASPGSPLIGMALLRGSRLQMDAVPGGEVVIEEL